MARESARVGVIWRLLDRHPEVVEDGRVAPDADASVREVDRLFRAMRDSRSHPLLVLEETGEKVSLRACHWHLVARWRGDPRGRDDMADTAIQWVAKQWSLDHEPKVSAT